MNKKEISARKLLLIGSLLIITIYLILAVLFPTAVPGMSPLFKRGSEHAAKISESMNAGINTLAETDFSAIEGYKGAGITLREQMKAFKEKIHVEFNIDEFTDDIVDDEWQKLQEAAFVVTDNPLEGDYLCRMADLEFEDDDDGILGEKLPDGSYHVTVDCTAKYFDTKEQEEEFIKKANEILESLDIKDASDYEKVKKIYDYICENVEYDYEHLEDDEYVEKYTAYAAAVKNDAVCAGIIRMFYYMAKSVGLDIRLVERIEHNWAFVKVDGKYYYIDPTWDLGMDPEDYSYFLKGRKDFEDHEGDEDLSKEEAAFHGFTDKDYDIPDYGYEPAGN